MNRNNLIAGGAFIVAAFLFPAMLGEWAGFVFSPILGLIGVILLLTGAFGSEGGARGGQQQQQMVVVHSGPTSVQLRCPGCGQISGTDARFCAGCGGKLA